MHYSYMLIYMPCLDKLWHYFTGVAFWGASNNKILHLWYLLAKNKMTTLRTHTTGSSLASDSHRQLPTNMADICHDWLTSQNMDCCFVVIGLVPDVPESFALQLKIDPVPQTGRPSLLAYSVTHRSYDTILLHLKNL